MTDARDLWVVADGMGGFVCEVCGTPVESEPCEEHQPEASALCTSIVESGGSGND